MDGLLGALWGLWGGHFFIIFISSHSSNTESGNDETNHPILTMGNRMKKDVPIAARFASSVINGVNLIKPTNEKSI